MVGADDLLEEWVKQDPIPAEHRRSAHLFVIAQPVVEHRKRLSSIEGIDVAPWVGREIAIGATWTGIRKLREPDLDSLVDVGPRLRRRGFAHRLPQDRRVVGDPATTEPYVLELEVGDDGGLRLFCGGATFGEPSLQLGTRRILDDLLVICLTWRVLRMAAQVSEQTGYLGDWLLG